MPEHTKTRNTWSWQQWQNVFALVLFLIGPAFLFGCAERLSDRTLVMLWGLLTVTLLALTLQTWSKIFGPVTFYEMVRAVRKRRLFVYRFLYALLLLGMQAWTLSVSRSFDWNTTNYDRMAQTALSLFSTFAIVQLALAALLTPAYVGGAITTEKEHQTLEYLLATDLDSREIVLGKLAARLASLGLLLITGLPVLSFLTFLGGVSPELMLASFAATGLIMLSMGALSIFISVQMRKSRDAIFGTYALAIAYLVVSGMSHLLPYWSRDLARFLPLDEDFIKSILDNLVHWLNAGNIFTALGKLSFALGRGGQLEALLPDLLRDFAIFHVLTALACSLGATALLRRQAMKEAESISRPKGKQRRAPKRPKVGRNPILWKETHIEGSNRIGWLGRIALGILILLIFAPVFMIFREYVRTSRYHNLAEEINIWVRIVGTLLACLMLLRIAVHASGGISGERDRQTWDAILTTPLESDAILFGKFAGSIVNTRFPWLLLALIALLGVVTKGLHPSAVPMLLVAWIVYAAVFALVGLSFSFSCRTSLRATLWTLFTLAGLSVGHWLLMAMCCYVPMRGGSGSNDLAIIEVGQTPPVVLALLAFSWKDAQDFFRHSGSKETELVFSILFGIGTWAVLAMVLWSSLASSFRETRDFHRPSQRRP